MNTVWHFYYEEEKKGKEKKEEKRKKDSVAQFTNRYLAFPAKKRQTSFFPSDNSKKDEIV